MWQFSQTLDSSSFAPQLWGQVSEKEEPGGLWPLQVHAEKVTQAPPNVLCLGEPKEIRGKSNFAYDFRQVHVSFMTLALASAKPFGQTHVVSVFILLICFEEYAFWGCRWLSGYEY